MGKSCWDIATGKIRGKDHAHKRFQGADMSDFTIDTSRGVETRRLRYSNGKYHKGSYDVRWSSPFDGLSERDEKAMKRYERSESNKRLMDCKKNIKGEGTHSGVMKKPDRKYLPNASADLVRVYLKSGGVIRFDNKTKRYDLILQGVKAAYVPYQVFATIQAEVCLIETRVTGTFFTDYMTKEGN